MSSTWSALRTTQSGTRSRMATPVIASTASARLSRCWMLTVLITAIPASSRSRTSSHRFSCGPEPGTLVWASSSTSTTSGCRSSTAARSISSKVVPRYSTTLRGTTGRSRISSAVCGRPWVSTNPIDHVGPALVAPPTLVEHGDRSCRRRPPTPGRSGTCPAGRTACNGTPRRPSAGASGTDPFCRTGLSGGDLRSVAGSAAREVRGETDSGRCAGRPGGHRRPQRGHGPRAEPPLGGHRRPGAGGPGGGRGGRGRPLVRRGRRGGRLRRLRPPLHPPLRHALGRAGPELGGPGGLRGGRCCWSARGGVVLQRTPGPRPGGARRTPSGSTSCPTC